MSQKMEEVTNGIRNVHLDNGHQSDSQNEADLQDLSGLPNALIVTNVADSIFEDVHSKVRALIFEFLSMNQIVHDVYIDASSHLWPDLSRYFF